MVASITEAQSHDEGRGGRSVTRVHKSLTGIQYKSITGGTASLFTRMYDSYILGHGNVSTN